MLFSLISWGIVCLSLLPHLIPVSPPSARSEQRYRAMELQMPPIRLGDRSEALGGPFCLILLWHGADERISYVRESHTVSLISHYI